MPAVATDAAAMPSRPIGLWARPADLARIEAIAAHLRGNGVAVASPADVLRHALAVAAAAVSVEASAAEAAKHREWWLERQREGVAKAKAAGVYRGRKPSNAAVQQGFAETP
jgi:DNA invertase Pin-like site-specific DNA recombinase